MMVNNRLLAAVLTAGALVSAAPAAAPATRLGLPPPAVHVSYGREGQMFAHREAGRYRRYGYGYGYYGAYAYGPYAALDAGQTPLYAAPAETPAATVMAYNSNSVCPVVWRWSARAGQAVRSWSYCNN
jgi:hypothetical protein